MVFLFFRLVANVGPHSAWMFGSDVVPSVERLPEASGKGRLSPTEHSLRVSDGSFQRRPRLSAKSTSPDILLHYRWGIRLRTGLGQRLVRRCSKDLRRMWMVGLVGGLQTVRPALILSDHGRSGLGFGRHSMFPAAAAKPIGGLDPIRWGRDLLSRLRPRQRIANTDA